MQAQEIESRYQQYRRAMQEYDDALQQANTTAEVQMSAVAPSYFQHSSIREFPMEAEDYFELDSEKMLLGISPPNGKETPSTINREREWSAGDTASCELLVHYLMRGAIDSRATKLCYRN